jgi:hypothetical protein
VRVHNRRQVSGEAEMRLTLWRQPSAKQPMVCPIAAKRLSSTEFISHKTQPKEWAKPVFSSPCRRSKISCRPMHQHATYPFFPLRCPKCLASAVNRSSASP